jgi:hypothetical protein
MPAFYSAPATEFLTEDRQRILGLLTERAAARIVQQLHTQTSAWLQQLEILQCAFAKITPSISISEWSVLLEYPIPRRGKRIDAIVLANGCVLALEFKCGPGAFVRTAAVAQIEDYCLDLRDFHRASTGRIIVPMIVATHAPDASSPPAVSSDYVQAVWISNESDLAANLLACVTRHAGKNIPIDLMQWDHSDYDPTPTIIEAAQALYAGNNVREISRCHAGITNLTQTSDAVLGLIDNARKGSQKVICFVTGVPGAGKTLAGLNIVHNHSVHGRNVGVFLSGNGPLVKVLTEALARDHRSRTEESLAESRRHVTAFIQNVHRFVEEYFAHPQKVPVDHVIVFDEAQRAWNAEQSQRKFKRAF